MVTWPDHPYLPFAKGLTGGLTNNNANQRAGRNDAAGGNEGATDDGGGDSVAEAIAVCRVRNHIVSGLQNE